MIPSLGRTVGYVLSEHDAQQINKRRQDAAASRIAAENSGAIVHFGSSVTPGDQCPMIITRVWADEDIVTEATAVNGQVLLDGNDTLWVTSVKQGDGECHWREFPRV